MKGGVELQNMRTYGVKAVHDARCAHGTHSRGNIRFCLRGCHIRLWDVQLHLGSTPRSTPIPSSMTS